MGGWRSVAIGLVLAAGAARAEQAACVGGVTRAPADPDPPRFHAADPYEAAQAGIDWLTVNLCTWMEGEGVATDCTDGQAKTCMGCHVQAETVLGLARSSKRCYTLPDTPCRQPGDESPIQFAVRFIAEAQRKDCIIGPRPASCPNPGQDPTTIDGYLKNIGSIGHYGPCGSNAGPASVHPMNQSTHGGLALAGYEDHVSSAYAVNTSALADWFVTVQAPAGNWVPDRLEAPVDQGELFAAGSALMILKSAAPYASPGQLAAYVTAMERAVAWMDGAARTTTQDKLFAVLGYKAASLPGYDVALGDLRSDVTDDQLADGGWAERPGLQSNAYATGQALHALLEAKAPVDDPAVCAGIQWLMDRQNADGSWSIGTVGVSTDSSRNSNFTATIWPVLALGSLRPFGALTLAPSPEITTCEDEASFEVVVSHAADTACGLFARPDTYDVTVRSDRGDTVWAVPSVVSLSAGGSETVTVGWRRAGPLPPAGTVSSVVVEVSSRGGEARGCPVTAITGLYVTAAADPLPGALDDGLRVAKEGSDVLVSWNGLDPSTVGGYELVSVECAERSSCPDDPTPTVLDARAPLATEAPGASATRLPGAALPGTPKLEYYKARAQSPCAFRPGPTCASVHPSRDACEQ